LKRRRKRSRRLCARKKRRKKDTAASTSIGITVHIAHGETATIMKMGDETDIASEIGIETGMRIRTGDRTRAGTMTVAIREGLGEMEVLVVDDTGRTRNKTGEKGGTGVTEIEKKDETGTGRGRMGAVDIGTQRMTGLAETDGGLEADHRDDARVLYLDCILGSNPAFIEAHTVEITSKPTALGKRGIRRKDDTPQRTLLSQAIPPQISMAIFS
jgi:hypothetical protein